MYKENLLKAQNIITKAKEELRSPALYCSGKDKCFMAIWEVWLKEEDMQSAWLKETINSIK